MIIDEKQKIINQFYYKRNMFRLIEGFINVVRHNGFTKAAEQMNLSPSTISTQIAVLENQFGVQLIKRAKGVKFIELTAEGLLFYNSVNEIFIALDNTIVNLHKDLVEYKNSVRIACHPLISRILLPQVIKEVHNSFPEVKFAIKEIFFDNALSELQNNMLDLMIYPKDLMIIDKIKGIHFTELFKYYPTVFCHPEHPVAKMKDEEIQLIDLQNGFVTISETDYVVKNNFLERNVNIKVSFYNTLLIVNSIKGIACLDKRTILTQDTEGLIIKDVAQITKTSAFFLIRNANNNKMNKVIDIIVDKSTKIN